MPYAYIRRGAKRRIGGVLCWDTSCDQAFFGWSLANPSDRFDLLTGLRIAKKRLDRWTFRNGAPTSVYLAPEGSCTLFYQGDGANTKTLRVPSLVMRRLLEILNADAKLRRNVVGWAFYAYKAMARATDAERVET